MASDVTRDEFQHLTTRVDVLEREVEGEKMVTRHILEQTRRNGDDLAAMRGRFDRVEGRLDRVEAKVDDLGHDLRNLKATVEGLVRNLPTIVSEAVRSAMPKRSKR
jgi:hypothetical protein